MSRKSSIVTLSILGVVASIGICLCCCWPAWNDPARDDKNDDPGAGAGDGGGGGGGRVVHHSRPRPWIPIFFGGGGGVSGPAPGPVHTGGTSGATSRGGFGATAGHGGGVGA